MAAYLLIRGMKTLALRIRRQNESALRIARWLEAQPAVAVVNYPGLESHPQHDVAARQMRGFGGVLSFGLEGGFEAVKRVLPRLRLAHRAANLGAVETIAGPPATTSHVECTAEERAAMGIPEGLIRYSVGHRGRRRPDRRPGAGAGGRVEAAGLTLGAPKSSSLSRGAGVPFGQGSRTAGS